MEDAFFVESLLMGEIDDILGKEDDILGLGLGGWEPWLSAEQDGCSGAAAGAEDNGSANTPSPPDSERQLSTSQIAHEARKEASDLEEAENERKRRRVLRNRESAARSRKRRHMRLDELEARTRQLEAANAAFRGMVCTLLEENKALRAVVSASAQVRANEEVGAMEDTTTEDAKEERDKHGPINTIATALVRTTARSSLLLAYRSRLLFLIQAGHLFRRPRLLSACPSRRSRGHTARPRRPASALPLGLLHEQ